jgi:hypothetical protein
VGVDQVEHRGQVGGRGVGVLFDRAAEAYGYILESRTNFIDCELEKDMA